MEPITMKLWTVLMILTLGLIPPVYATEPMVGEVGDIEMWIDTSEKFDDEASAANNRLNVLIAAYIAADGNLEIEVIDEHTIHISIPNEGDES